MRIALIDPFYDTSHQYWAEGLQKHSQHDIVIYSNPPRNWKWQMIGGTLELADRIRPDIQSFDILLVTDMIDLPCFVGYLKEVELPPLAIYFHENQITYPWSSTDPDLAQKRDHHYGFMNVRSALVADHIIFNSEYHQRSFLASIPSFIKMFPSIQWPDSLFSIKMKSSVLPIGLADIKEPRNRSNDGLPIFLWNHRWEYDKNPNEFFQILFGLKERDTAFKLVVLGKSYKGQPSIFQKAKEKLKDHIIHWGYADSRAEYLSLIQESNIALVTSNQDFFGISVVEAIHHGNYPLLPDRLSYPEHIHPDHHQCIYQEGTCAQALNAILANKSYRDTTKYREFIKKYLWSSIIGSYDVLFENVRIQSYQAI